MPDPNDDLSSYAPEVIDPEKPDFFTAKTQAQVNIASSVKTSLNVARTAGMTPDREAKVVSTSARTGLAPATVRRLPDHYLDPNAPDPVQLAKQSPATAAFLGQSPTNAAIGGQDWQSLSNIEGWRSALAAEQKRADDELAAQKPPISLAEAYGQGSRTVGLGEAYYQNYILGNAQHMEWAATQEQAQKEYAERDQTTSGLRYVLNSAAEMVPIMGSALEAGAKGGLATGMVAAGAAAIGGQLGPQIAAPEEIVTVPAAAIGGLMVGGSAAMAGQAFRLEAGLAAHEMAQIRDLNGKPIDPALVKTAAVGIGALNAGLEMFGWSKLAGTLPTGWIKSAFGKKALASALIDPDVEKALKTVAAKYGTAVAAETGTEMAQEVSNILGGWIATHAAEMLDDQSFGQQERAVFTADNIGQVFESGKKAFAASLVFGAPGTALTAYQQTREVREAKTFRDWLANTNEAVNASPMQGRSPEKMREFLQIAGHSGEAFIDPDTAVKLPAEVLAKVGIGPDAVAEADITGQSISVRLEDLQTKLTPEEFKQVLPGVKAGQRLPSEAQAKEFKSSEELARAADTYDAATMEETQFKQSLKNLRRDFVASIEETPQLREQIRAQGITAGDYADNVLQLWEGMSRRLALEGRELNETLRKVTAGAVPQEPQMRGAGRTFTQAQPLSDEAKSYVASLTPEEQAALAPSIEYLEQNPDPKGDLGNLQMVVGLMKGKTLEQRDGATLLTLPQNVSHSALVKQWRKAHGDRTPVTGDKDWQALVEKSDAADLQTNGRTFNQDSRQTETPAFKKWFGGSRVVDENGDPLVVYHGTTSTFDSFNKEKANPESDLGAGFYFTNTHGDVGSNYAGEGPDLTQKITMRAEQIASENDWEYNDPRAKEMARKEFSQHGGATMPVYLAIKNPVILGRHRHDETLLEMQFDEDAGTESGNLVDFINGLREASESYSDVDIDQAVADLTSDGYEITAREAIEKLSQSEGLQNAMDDTGKLVSKEIIRQAFEKAGFDGFIDHTVNEKFGSERQSGKQMEGMDEETVHYIAFKPTQIKSAIGNRGTFSPRSSSILKQGQEQAGGGEAQANVQIIGEGDAYIVNIFKGANLSSILHESAHVFLSELSLLVDSGTASQAMLKDWASLTKWLGVDLLDDKLTETQYKAAHEQFARGFEEYLREGKAPSPELADAFERFKKWLVKVYQTVAALGPDRVPLTDEVRATFGRLIATQEEVRQSIAQNELVVRTEADLAKLGLGPEEKARINELLEQGRTRTEQSLQRRRDAGNRAREKAWRAEAVRDILSQPVYEAMATIKQGGGLRGVAIGYDFGSDTVKALRERGLIAPKNADGMQARDVAGAHRFDSEEALILALLDAQPSREAAIAFHVEQQRAAYDATHTVEESLTDAKEFADYMEEMGRYLGRALKDTTAVSQKAFQTIAENRVMNMPMAQAIKSDGALAAMQLALRTERRAMAKGDFKTALKANDRARLNFEMAKVSRKMRTMLERTQASGNKNARADQGTIEEQHHLNLTAMLQRYGLLTGTTKLDLDKRQSLRSLVEPSESDAADPSDLFPDWLLNEDFPQGASTWGSMSGHEFQQMSDALKFLNGRGRAMVSDAVAFSDLTRTQIADEVTRPVAELTNKATVSPDSYWGRLIRGARAYYASLDQFLFVLRRADGSTNVGPKGEAGPNERLIYRPLAKAWSDKKVLGDTIKGMVKPHIEQLRKSMWAAPKYLLNTGVPYPELLKKKHQAWTFEQVVSIALNMGNEYNRQAVLDGYGMTEADLQALTSVLKPEDWNAIQGIWNAIDSLWPQIDAVHYRLNHIHQEKVAASPFVTGTGQHLEGGYYPVKFDSELSATVGEWTEADNFMNSTHALFPAPNVAKGFTKARSGTGGKPVALTIRTLGDHLDFATQYITHAEVVKDMDRIMVAKVKGETNPYYSLIAQKMGEDVAKLLRPTLKHIARPEGEILEWVDKLLSASKGMATAYILGLNIKTALTNLTGITTVLSEAGVGTVFRGYSRVVADPRGAYAEMVKMSPYMASRAQIYDRDVRRQLDDLSLDNRMIPGATREAVKASAFIFLWATDLAMVMPSWWGVYQKTLAANGGDTQAAVTVADEFVAATNPSARPIDLAQLQRSNKGLHRLFTMFSSFTIKYGNRQRLYYSAWKNGNLNGLEYMRHIVLEAMLPSLITTVGYGMLWGHDPSEEDDVKHTLADLAIYQFQGLPFFRDVIGAGISWAADDFVRDPTKSPVFTGLDLAKKMGSSMYGFAADLEDDAKMEKALWAFADAVSFKVGVPVPKLFRNLREGVRQWEEEDGATFMNVLVPDPDAKERK
jgi:hypothetical protein